MILEKLYDMVAKLIKGNEEEPPVRSSDNPPDRESDNPHVRNSDLPKVVNISEGKQFLRKMVNDTDILDSLNNLVKNLVNKLDNSLNGVSPHIPSYINLNGKSWIPALDLKELALKLTQIVYLYNFEILKNDEYKKIVVIFPGSSTYLQIIDELYYEEMIDLPITNGKQHYYVMKYFYNIFSKIEEDLFNTLEPLVNNEDYQVIFSGHSIGGAIATLASFYYIKKYNFSAENILITFGQPKVGSENFEKN